jgi:hypothetical protein
MTTTQVFIELLITGFGSLIWIILLFFGINGLDFKLFLELAISNIFLLPIAGLAYIIGIIVDRIGFQLFKKKERKNIHKVFSEDEDRSNVQFKVVYIIQNSDHLKSKIDYNRSRLRLTRSWIINFFMITLSLIIYSITTDYENTSILLSLLVISFFFCILSFYTWNKLSGDYYKNIKSSFENLKKT